MEFSYAQAQRNLAGVLSFAKTEQVYIKQKDGKRFLITAEPEDETEYLLRSPANKKNLLESIRQMNAGETRPVKEVFDELGIDRQF